MTIKKPNSNMRACWVSSLPGADRIRASIVEPLREVRARLTSSQDIDAGTCESPEHDDQPPEPASDSDTTGRD